MMLSLVLDLLNVEEGFRSSPYYDSAGVPTIGYGSTFYKDGSRVTMADPPISKADALDLKKFVVNQFWSKMDPLIKVPLNDHRKAALISLVYNIGPTGFAGSTVLRLINKNPEDPAIRDAFRMWRYARVNGVLKPILLDRRDREADLYFKKKVVADPVVCCCPCHSQP